MEFNLDDNVLRHKYGVALSRLGKTREAIDQFSMIIDSEVNKAPARDQVLIALSTRILNYERMGRSHEANADKELAKKIISENEHLKSYRHDFE